jgi:hypothetical protein
LPDVAGRRRAVAVALAGAALIISLAPATPAAAASPPGLDRFLYALGEVESGGDYTARNPTTGAYGKYQILPSNWPAWAKLYLGSSTAPQTPANQETVAHRKVTALYNWLDSWAATAHWWLTGSSDRNPANWSDFSRAYVNRVMSLMASAGDVVGSFTVTPSTNWLDPNDTRVADNDAQIVYRSSWGVARHWAYSMNRAKFATTRGASATITFTGTGIAWFGPVGPTRGSARVYIDGKAIATIDLRRSTFAAHRLLFARPLSAGTHTFRIVVVSSGRPVAIDDLFVGT